MTGISIAVQVHNFQRRFCWMLSSLAQQTRPELVRVIVDYMPENGRPTTDEVCDLFDRRRGGNLRIYRKHWLSLEQFQFRGLVRNGQMARCRTEWIMFGDADMVYHPEYFERLSAELGATHAGANYLICSGRMSNPKNLTNDLVNSRVMDEAQVVAGSWALADRLPKNEMRNVGAGFSQIVNMKTGAHGGYYVNPKRNMDWSWGRGSNPKSDIQFRSRLAKATGILRRKLPHWFTESAIHLNHNRDPEAGHHLEEQR